MPSNIKALLLAGAITSAWVTLEATQQTETESPNGLRMSLVRDEAASGPDKAFHFTVIFSNSKSEDITFIPGTLVDCGRVPSRTSLIELNLKDAQGNQHRHLPYLGDGPPYQMFCAGQITPFVAVLRPGESLSLPLDICKYLDLSDSKQYEEVRFPAGKYSLEAEFKRLPSQPNAASTEQWAGRVRSNFLEVQFEHEFAAPLGDYPQ